MAEALTGDDTIQILKGVLYGFRKEQVPQALTAEGGALWDTLTAERDAGGAMMDIPSDFPDMSGVKYHKL
jgi:hypothetical protein